MDDEKGYEIVDKRGAADDGQEADASPEQEPEADAAQEEPAKAPEEGAVQEEETAGAPVDVYGVLVWMINILGMTAWQALGLQVNPATGKAEKDLVQAKTAIDTLVFLVDKVSPHVEEPMRRELRRLLTDLQMNFVQQSG